MHLLALQANLFHKEESEEDSKPLDAESSLACAKCVVTETTWHNSALRRGLRVSGLSCKDLETSGTTRLDFVKKVGQSISLWPNTKALSITREVSTWRW